MVARRFASWKLMVMLILMASLLAVPAAAAAPFSFTVTPVSAEASPGSTVTYTVAITASPGFSRPVDFSMKIQSAGYSETLDLGTYSGPYPETFTYSLPVPSQVPAGVSAVVAVTGASNQDEITQILNLKVTGEGGQQEGILSAITSALNSILHALGLR
jgi:hypothetical protein